MKDPKAVAAVRERRERANDARMHECARERTNDANARTDGRRATRAMDDAVKRENIAREKAGD